MSEPAFLCSLLLAFNKHVFPISLYKILICGIIRSKERHRRSADRKEVPAVKQMTSYSVRIRDISDKRSILSATAGIYRDAVDFYIRVCMKEWGTISTCSGQARRVNCAESLTVRTKKRPFVPYDFGTGFYKFPSYLRRAAIAEALGSVSSYKSNMENWASADPRTRGKRPGPPSAGHTYPAMYRDNMFVRTGTYTASVKVYTRGTWDWLDIDFRKSDVDYIRRHCGSRTECVPTLRRRGKRWYLDFAFEEKITLPRTDVSGGRVLAVDLGINSACTCCAMEADGTVTGREFLKLPGENDRLSRALGRIRKAQRHGAKRMPRLWARARGISRRIAVLTAEFIVRNAVLFDADTIVMEHLSLRGKKRGSRKQRLHLWRAAYVRKMVEDRAHREGIHVSTVCAWNTSRLAFDGTGRVKRGRESGRTGGSYSVCEFQTGKVYNCDLNASYNIGARYCVRAFLKPLPATVKQRLEAEVPSAVKRSTCTLSTLISLRAALAAAAAGC